MLILAIDPGPVQSAWVTYGRTVFDRGITPNEEVLSHVLPGLACAQHLAIEMIGSYGMPVGAEVFETCVWIGRFVQAWGGDFSYVLRKDVKMHLCSSMRARDSNIRQALIDKLGPPGKKASPGPTYGIRKDEWAALAVAVTYLETREEQAA